MRISQLQYYCNVISQISVLSKLKAHANSVFLIDYKSRAFISTFFLKIHLPVCFYCGTNLSSFVFASYRFGWTL